MNENRPDNRPREPRKIWKIALYAAALAANLLAVAVLVRDLIGGGDFTPVGILGTVLCGIFAAFLYWELGKPKA